MSEQKNTVKTRSTWKKGEARYTPPKKAKAKEDKSK